MERVLSWLNQPLFEGCPILIWMAVAAGIALLAACVLALCWIKRRRKKGKRREQTVAPPAENPATENPTTAKPKPLPELELYNLQGIGMREEQQDAFGLSRMEAMQQHGLLAVLCDGMGGMAEGGRIAAETVSELLSVFPWESDRDVPGWVQNRSRQVYRQFRGRGGTTLVAALLRENRLSFWYAGDSDLFLLRKGELFSLSWRQEYKNELVLRALEGKGDISAAFLDAQAGALAEYIGKDSVSCGYTRKPLLLQPEDALLLCSDGVSDTLTLKQIRQAMELSPKDCCDALEREILAAELPNQDNYTAIVLKYHGKKRED